jgi:hypothetical protein
MKRLFITVIFSLLTLTSCIFGHEWQGMVGTYQVSYWLSEDGLNVPFIEGKSFIKLEINGDNFTGSFDIQGYTNTGIFRDVTRISTWSIDEEKTRLYVLYDCVGCTQVTYQIVVYGEMFTLEYGVLGKVIFER